MSPEVPPSRTSIGATLRDARRRYGLEVREVEERTKIRARYIRALENEDWETLPAPAYVRGFLRTYGQLLGLDGDMLADEYRRTYGEGPAATGAAPPEPLLSERRRPGDRQPPSRGVIIGGIVLGIVVLIFILGLLGGDGGDETGTGDAGKAAKSAKQDGGKGKGDGGDGKPDLGPEKAVLETKTAVEVCLVGDGKEALIDAQQLQEGDTEEFDGYELYRLDIGPGDVTFTVAGDTEKIAVTEDSSFEADSTGIRQIDPAGPECP
jgi:cytoskeleton protein RodZ